MENEIFGICDDEDGNKAYTNLNNIDSWVATVENNEKVELTFTAIDNCLFPNDEFTGRKRCDGMLTSEKHLYFIELKDWKQGGWLTHAIKQLGSTIDSFVESHPAELDKYQHKKAFACNKRSNRFIVIDHERKLTFFRRYKFRLDVQSKVLVV